MREGTCPTCGHVTRRTTARTHAPDPSEIVPRPDRVTLFAAHLADVAALDARYGADKWRGPCKGNPNAKAVHKWLRSASVKPCLRFVVAAWYAGRIHDWNVPMPGTWIIEWSDTPGASVVTDHDDLVRLLPDALDAWAGSLHAVAA